ncbi:Collagenase, partial [Caligus rogercresseyi]
IINGKEAAMNQFPWLVAVTSGGLCTGSVLDEEWIITAKHCVNVGNTVWIKAGVHNRDHNLDNEPNMQIRESKEIYVSDKGDFALIKLPEPLELN